MTDWSSTPLRADHDLHAFDSGQPSLDHWLRDHARRAAEQGTARTFVWTRDASPQVEAYYSIAPTQIARDALTSSQAGGVDVVPGYLLARLALARSLQGDRLGGQLLLDALEHIVAASQHGGGRLAAVDAIDARAERFYSNFDFLPARDVPTGQQPSDQQPSNQQPGEAADSDSYPRRMVIKIATVRAQLGL